MSPERWRAGRGRPLRLVPAAWVGVALGCAACVGGPQPGSVTASMRPPERGGESVGAKPVALVGGEPITWSQIQPALAELAGADALEELALDRAVSHEFALRGLRLEAGVIERERALFLETVRRMGTGTEEERELLVLRVRAARGLGETRFAALLRRNAMLRAMVRERVIVTDEDVNLGYEIRRGQRYRVRLIVTRTAQEAASLHERLGGGGGSGGGRGGGGSGGETFAAVASRESIDPSASRGGDIGEISPADPAYPAAVRSALTRLAAGETSPPVALEQGFALLHVEEIVAASPLEGSEREAALAEMRAEVGAVRERAEMERLGRELLRGVNVTVLDPALNWSWRQRDGETGGAARDR